MLLELLLSLVIAFPVKTDALGIIKACGRFPGFSSIVPAYQIFKRNTRVTTVIPNRLDGANVVGSEIHGILVS